MSDDRPFPWVGMAMLLCVVVGIVVWIVLIVGWVLDIAGALA